MYSILDFKAVAKHTYYGCQDPEAVLCEKTGRRYAGWKAAANSFLDRYILPILENSSPRHLIVAHDTGRDYRKALFPGYKAKRDANKENLSPIELENIDALYVWAKRFLAALGTTQIGVKGVEADDVIAWLCQGIQYPKSVYTVDGDLVQLVNDKTVVYLKEEAFFGEGSYKGVPYHLTSLAKSITGDSSDEYPGIKGMGDKKIADLLENYGADGLEQLQEVVETGDKTLLEKAVSETGDKSLIKLLDNFGEWRTQWRIAKLHPELCWKPRAKKLVKPEIHKRLPNPTRLHQLLKEVGCEDMWDSVFADMMPSKIAITNDNWEDYRDAILDEMAAGDLVAFDYETADKEPIEAFWKASTSGTNFVDMLSHQLVGASFCFGKHNENVVYLPVDHKNSPNLPKAVVAELLEHAGQVSRRCAHNALFEGVISQTNLGMELQGVYDTRIMQRYFDENEEAGLKALSLHYLKYEQATFEETLAAGNGGEGVANMSELTLEEVFNYGCDDAQVTSTLFDLLQLLLQLDGQWAFYEQWAVDPTVVLQHSYINGVDINWTLQKQLHERDLKTVAEGTKQLREILEKNVKGEVTAGCESLIEAEKDYIFRAAKKKADGNSEVASTKLYEWKTKQERACQYLPYSVERVMPRFAFTPTQLTAAAEAVGLPPVTKVSQSGLTEYLTDQGMVGFDTTLPDDERQAEFLRTLKEAVAAGVHRLKTLEAAMDRATEEGSEEDIQAASSAYNRAKESLDKAGDTFQKLAGVTAKEITSGDELNVGSPQQMQQLLYCKIGVPVRLRGKNVGKGRLMVGIREAGPSTDESAIMHALANDIEKGSWQEEALHALLQVKSASTRISLYHDKYPLWKHRDGKIHPSFTDAGTDTRRPTGSSPNVLQVSKKDKSMRSQFVPPGKDYVCVAIDYNGQELRLLACESGDPVMIDAYNPEDEKDLHSVTGSGIAALKATKAGSTELREGLQAVSEFAEFNQARSLEDHPLHKLADGIRKSAKGVNFGLAYGAAAPTLSRNLVVPVEEADELLSGAMRLYARIPQWQQETAKFMERNGFTLTAFGTKRHATEDVFSKDRGKVSRQHRQGANATIQGTAAEMLRIVLTGIVRRNLLHRLDMVFFAPIYDETVAWVHKKDVVEYCREMGEIMSSATPPSHPVPQIPEFSIGPDWGRVHELGRNPSEEAINAAVERSLEEAVEMWEQMEEAA